MYKPYTGIGSRETPAEILDEMLDLGQELSRRGYTLRSGGAPGADTAFETGANYEKTKPEIYLPWKCFEKRDSPYFEPDLAAFAIAETVHPAWFNLSQGAKRLHARNVHQVLGANLYDSVPSLFLICWTKNGEFKGGTATAMRIAENHHIPIVNLALSFWKDLLDSF